MKQQTVLPTILIADDNRDFCALVRRSIEKDGGCTLVGEVHDGVDAVNEVVRLQPDILLLDMIMPRLDGLGVLEHLQSMKLEKRLHIAMISAVHDDHFTQKALSLGADYYFIKPFNLPLMLRRMKDLVLDGNSAAVAKPEFSDKLPQSGQMVQLVTSMLQELGVPVNLQGFYFLREGILLALEDINNLAHGITKVMYPAIALKFDSTPTRVERSIRSAIEGAWDRGRVEVINRIFGFTVQMDRGKPTNSEFIAMIADRVRMQLTQGE